MDVDLLFRLSDVYMEESDETIEVENPSQLLGDICVNRVNGIAFHNIRKLKNLKFAVEYVKALKVMYDYDLKRTINFKEVIKYLSEILNHADFKYVLLKGAFLTTKLYEAGFRTSNDVDILVHESDITKCQELLKKNGFIQGYKRQGAIQAASRKEILMSRMNYGEVVPFHKIINDEIISIDINFSVDYKPDEADIVQRLLDNVVEVSYEEQTYKTLDPINFLIHLCCHLYKEATTQEWVERKKDLQLYKFSDINLFMHEMIDENTIDPLIETIHRLNVQKECYYTFRNSSIIYPNMIKLPGYTKLLEKIKPENNDFMYEIIFPLEKKIYYYEMDFRQWFDLPDRTVALKLKG